MNSNLQVCKLFPSSVKYKRLVNPATGQVILPTEYPDYSKVEYWNNRYREERGQTFDWYLPAWKGVGGLRDLIVPRLYEDKEAEILVVGCGNSGKDGSAGCVNLL